VKEERSALADAARPAAQDLAGASAQRTRPRGAVPHGYCFHFRICRHSVCLRTSQEARESSTSPRTHPGGCGVSRSGRYCEMMRLPTFLQGSHSPDHPALGETLHEHGAVLVRDSGLASAEDFQSWLAASGAELLEYDYGSTPRSQVSGRIYTSTEYPPHQTIPQHNEMSYTDRWPGRLWFFCAKPSSEGGRTPLCAAGEVLRKLDPALRARFESQGVMYVRNYNLGVDLTWQQAFGTPDRREVERRARERGLAIAWGPADQLTTRQIAQAVTQHPVTGEWVWFNQAHLFHISAVEPSVREGLLAAFGEVDLPRNAYYGNGRPIEDAALDEIRGVYRELTTGFDWQAGDVLIVDNVLVTHGRTPFRGERRVLVAMSERLGRR